MAEENKKLDIEDIKDPEDIDIDEVVSEKEPIKNETPEASEVKEPETAEDDRDVLEKVVEEEKPTEVGKAKDKKLKKQGNKNLLKYLLIALLVAVVIAAAVLGAMYYLKQRNKPTETADTNTNQTEQTEEEVVNEEETVAETKYLYINSEVGLNLRETPSPKAKVLAIIPFGYKITVLDEQDDWVKTTYSGKTGWVVAEYTQATSPLVYENDTYGFGLTFKSSWAGYKFIEADNEGSTTVKTYYVALPTTDKSWKEPALPAGYASLFVMGVYTKAEWAKLAGQEMLPAKLGEGTKYVYTYLPGQAYASDLKTQYYEVKAIIDTFEVLK